jgi:hypothetical protein
MKTYVPVRGGMVSVGDTVWFKSDIEQSGVVEDVRRSSWGQMQIVISNEYGFEGDYIGGSTVTVQSARDCWVE